MFIYVCIHSIYTAHWSLKNKWLVTTLNVVLRFWWTVVSMTGLQLCRAIKQAMHTCWSWLGLLFPMLAPVHQNHQLALLLWLIPVSPTCSLTYMKEAPFIIAKPWLQVDMQMLFCEELDIGSWLDLNGGTNVGWDVHFVGIHGYFSLA